MNKAILGGAAAIVAGFLLLSKRSNAATPPAQLPTTRRPPDDPGGSGVVTIPTVVVHGDVSSIAWGDDVLNAAAALEPRLNPNGSSAYGQWGIPAGDVLAFQQAYNADPTSKNPSNVLGTPQAPVYFLVEDDKYGPQTATAFLYVTGGEYPG